MTDAMRAPMSSEHDSRVVELRDLFRELDRVANRADRFGWDHPATASALTAAESTFAEALQRNPTLARVLVTPGGFVRDELMVWIPEATLEGAPARLHSAGIRALGIASGITAAELRAWISAMAEDVAGTLADDDDVASRLWDAAIDHVRFVLSATPERAAASAAGGRNRLRVPRPRVDRVLRADLARAFAAESLRPSSTSVVDVMLSELVIDSHAARAALRERLRAAALDLVSRGGLGRISEIYDALRASISAPEDPRLEAARLVEEALFDRDVFAAALARLAETPAEVARFASLIEHVDGVRVPEALAALAGGADGELRALLERFVERAARGREADIARAIVDAPREVAVRLLAVLSRVKTSAAAAEISRLSSHADDDVRLDAKLLAGADVDAAQESVIAMIDAADVKSRDAALRAVGRHKLTRAIPTLLRHLRAPAFVERSVDEQRELLRALLKLSPSQGEIVALEIVRRGGMFQSDAREATRIVAIELLGELGVSRAAVDAMRDIARTHWGAAQATRDAAERAARSMDERTSEMAVVSQAPSKIDRPSMVAPAVVRARFDFVPPALRAEHAAAWVLRAATDSLANAPKAAAASKRASQLLADLDAAELAEAIGMLASAPLRSDEARCAALVATVTAAVTEQLDADRRDVAEAALAALECELARAASRSNGPESITSARSFGRLDEASSRRLVQAADSFAAGDLDAKHAVKGRILATARRFVRALAGRTAHGSTEAAEVVATMLESAETPEDKLLVALVGTALDPPPVATARGTLEVTPFVHLLAYMLDHRASGTIELRSPTGERRLVSFRKGSPIAIQPVPQAPVTPELAVAGLARMPASTKYAYYKDLDLIEGEHAPVATNGALSHALAAARAWPDRGRMERMLGRIAHRRLVLHPQARLAGLDSASIDAEILGALRRGTRLPELRAAHADALPEVDTLIYVLAVMRQLSLPGLRGDPIG